MKSFDRHMRQQILLIQTAFIGDAILATGVLEKLHACFPGVSIDILVKRGNQSLFTNHPFIHKVMVLDKSLKRRVELGRLLREIRKERYDLILNLHRFASSGFLTACSRAKETRGFSKNPFSRFFSKRFPHEISATGTLHEIERNHQLIRDLTDEQPGKPRLYPSPADFHVIPTTSYHCIAPASVWATKQYPAEGWIHLMNQLPSNDQVYLLGGPHDTGLCSKLALKSRHPLVRNMAGELSLLQSAALMSGARMNYVNDSAPLHLASAMNAPVTAVFCSTVPEFGFGPLSDRSHVADIEEVMACRPCGIHGRNACPKGHFNCGNFIVSPVSV